MIFRCIMYTSFHRQAFNKPDMLFLFAVWSHEGAGQQQQQLIGGQNPIMYQLSTSKAVQDFATSQSLRIVSGWWLTYPSDKYESQLGWLSPIYGKIKNVPNHQPGFLHPCNGFDFQILTGIAIAYDSYIVHGNGQKDRKFRPIHQAVASCKSMVHRACLDGFNNHLELVIGPHWSWWFAKPKCSIDFDPCQTKVGDLNYDRIS